jgi:arsenate reductase (glutaredoxin)
LFIIVENRRARVARFCLHLSHPRLAYDAGQCSLPASPKIVIKLYGISNCDTVKKARAWLDSHDVGYEFVDFKKSPPSSAQVNRWCDALGVDAVVNRRGTTWRELEPDMQARAETQAGAVALLVAHPSAIKRPVVETGTQVLIGFDEARYTRELRR